VGGGVGVGGGGVRGLATITPPPQLPLSSSVAEPNVFLPHLLPLTEHVLNARNTRLSASCTTIPASAPTAPFEGGGSKDSGEEDRNSMSWAGVASMAPVRTTWMLDAEVVVTVLCQRA
jgi:hypothetical protein